MGEAKGGRKEREHRIFHRARATLVTDLGGSLTTKAGPVFGLCATDGDVDLERNPGHGVYFHDMRHLDRSTLRLDGGPLSVLLAEADGGRSICELTNPDIQLRSGDTLPKERLGVRRERLLDRGIVERITVRNYSAQRVTVELELELGCAFDSMFTVRGAPAGRRGREHDPTWEGGRLVLRYDGADHHRRTTTFDFDPPPSERSGGQLLFRLELKPGASSTIEARAELADDGPGPLPKSPGGAPEDAFGAVSVTTSNDLFDRVLKRGFDDLRMLLMTERGNLMFAAGVPWFVALFGRDSLITALEVLPYAPAIAGQTLRLLASYQGERDDDWRDEQAGKILHELRVGEQANLGEVPQTPYFGSVDSTPLFLCLLAEYVRWTGDLDLYRELREPAARALAWIDQHGDSDGDGFVDYRTRSRKGFRNQGWKDSGNSIVNADGSLAEPPIALVEVQGYVYLAKRGLARVERALGDHAQADRLDGEASTLRRRFEERFWSPGRRYLALALGAGGRPAEAIASNPGQALWSGIVAGEHVGDVCERLVGDDLFSGWGIRTLAASEPAFNPVDYQVGAVWPHDNALIMAGLKRAGRTAEAGRVFTALFHAAALFPHYRLPEVFAGFGRDQYPVPVRYPVACNPQAWAAGAIPCMLASALGLEPDALAGRLEIATPALPDWLPDVTIRGLRVGKGRVDLRYVRSGEQTMVAVLERDHDLDVVVTHG